MSRLSRLTIFSKVNVIDFSIVVIAICAPYILVGGQSVLNNSFPIFQKGIVLKHAITIGVLFFRIAIARGQKPYSDNSLSMIFLVTFILVWTLLGSKLDSTIVDFLLRSLWLQVAYWLVFVLMAWLFLFELAFQKKQVLQLEIKRIKETKAEIDIETSSLEKKITKTNESISELELNLGGEG